MRSMQFERYGYDVLDIPLEEGILCLIKPPANNYWLHSIPTDTSTKCHIGVVFRNF